MTRSVSTILDNCSHRVFLVLEHPHVVPPVSNLGNVVYKSLGRYTEAEPLFKRPLAMREKALGPDHPDVAQGA